MKLKELLFAFSVLFALKISAQAPNPITDLAASNTTETTTNLSWTTPSGTVTEYKIYQDGNSTEIATTTDLFYIVTGLTINTSYDFNVIAFNLTEGSPDSNIETVSTSDVTAPDAITTLSSNTTTETTTILTWSTPNDNIGVTSYEVFQDAVSIGTIGASPFFIVSGLTAGVSYNFTVFASDAAMNTSLVSDTEFVLAADFTAPSTITDLTASSTDENSTDLTWTAANDNVAVTNYEVFQDGVSIGLTGGAITMNATGLADGTSYDFTVYAIDATANASAASNTENVVTTDITAPSAITDLTASNITDITVDLSWTVATDNVAVTNYQVFQGAASLGLTGGATTFNVTGLSEATSYNFTVYAIDAATNTSAVSNTENVITSDVTAPSTIADLVASNTDDDSTDLNWTAATDNVAVTDYEVFQDAVSIGLTGGAITFNVTGLTDGASYDFTVYAIDATANTSAVSNTENVIISDITPPSTITDLTASNITDITVDLSWTAATDNVAVTDYQVFQDAVFLGLTGGTTIYNVTGLADGTSYDFTVYAIDAVANTSAVSNTENVVTTDITAPSAITDLSASNTTETTTDLSWTAATDNVAVTDYEVFQDAVSLGQTSGATTFNVTGLTIDTSYNFTVYAIDAVPNTSTISNTENVITSDTTSPSTIADLTSSGITYTTAELSWSPATDNIGVVNYEVFQDNVSIGVTGGFTSYSVSGLVELTIYQFKVTAIDVAGNSSELSNVEIVETPKESGSIPYTNLNANLVSVDWTAKGLYVVNNIGVGTFPSANYKLAVDGNIIAEEVRVALKANWPDYVFDENYELQPLTEVEKFIAKYGHLKNIPSAKEAELNGISIGEMNAKLLRKIEELTLYIIQQEKKINELSEDNIELQSLKKQVLEIEKALKELKK